MVGERPSSTPLRFCGALPSVYEQHHRLKYQRWGLWPRATPWSSLHQRPLLCPTKAYRYGGWSRQPRCGSDEFQASLPAAKELEWRQSLGALQKGKKENSVREQDYGLRPVKLRDKEVGVARADSLLHPPGTRREGRALRNGGNHERRPCRPVARKTARRYIELPLAGGCGDRSPVGHLRKISPMDRGGLMVFQSELTEANRMKLLKWMNTLHQRWLVKTRPSSRVSKGDRRARVGSFRTRKTADRQLIFSRDRPALVRTGNSPKYIGGAYFFRVAEDAMRFAWNIS